MRNITILTIFLLFNSFANAQILVTKTEVLCMLKETLNKSRNAVSTATNIWRYDNSNKDYFKNDTIILNTARSFKMDYCVAIYWDFYEYEKFILEFIPECTEPPTRLISKKEDYVTLKIEERENRIYFELNNLNGIFETFELLQFQKNKPIYNDENQFDYTIKLLRVKSK